MLTLCPKCITTHTKNITSFNYRFGCAQRLSRDLQTLSATFQNWNTLGSRKSSEVTGTFLEIPGITRQKSHVFEKS